jgi:hypothetical protein
MACIGDVSSGGRGRGVVSPQLPMAKCSECEQLLLILIKPAPTPCVKRTRTNPQRNPSRRRPLPQQRSGGSG